MSGKNKIIKNTCIYVKNCIYIFPEANQLTFVHNRNSSDKIKQLFGRSIVKHYIDVNDIPRTLQIITVF